MTIELYALLLSLSGAIIVTLLGIIISASVSLFKNVSTLLIATKEIQTKLSERHEICMATRLAIDTRLNEHDTILTEHKAEIMLIKSKIKL